MKKTLVDLQKLSCKTMRVPNTWRHMVAARHSQRTAQHPARIAKVGVTLVDWERGIVHCVLIQNLKNISNHSNNYLHSVVPEFWP